MEKNIRIKLIRSLSGCTQRQRSTVTALGLRKREHVVEKKETPQIRGMVYSVRHLLQVNEGK